MENQTAQIESFPLTDNVNALAATPMATATALAPEKADTPDSIQVAEYIKLESPKYDTLLASTRKNGSVSDTYAANLQKKTPESTFLCIGCIDEGAQVKEGTYALAGNGVLYWMQDRMDEFAKILIRNNVFTLYPHDNCGAKKAAMDLYNERTVEQNRVNGTNLPLYTDQYQFFEEVFLPKAQAALVKAGSNSILKFQKIPRNDMVRAPHFHHTAVFTINGTSIDLSKNREYPTGFVSSLRATGDIDMSITELLFALEKIVFTDHGIGGLQDFLKKEDRFILGESQPFLINIMVNANMQGDLEKIIPALVKALKDSRRLNTNTNGIKPIDAIKIISTIIPEK